MKQQSIQTHAWSNRKHQRFTTQGILCRSKPVVLFSVSAEYLRSIDADTFRNVGASNCCNKAAGATLVKVCLLLKRGSDSALCKSDQPNLAGEAEQAAESRVSDIRGHHADFSMRIDLFRNCRQIPTALSYPGAEAGVRSPARAHRLARNRPRSDTSVPEKAPTRTKSPDVMRRPQMNGSDPSPGPLFVDDDVRLVDSAAERQHKRRTAALDTDEVKCRNQRTRLQPTRRTSRCMRFRAIVGSTMCESSSVAIEHETGERSYASSAAKTSRGKQLPDTLFLRSARRIGCPLVETTFR